MSLVEVILLWFWKTFSTVFPKSNVVLFLLGSANFDWRVYYRIINEYLKNRFAWWISKLSISHWRCSSYGEKKFEYWFSRQIGGRLSLFWKKQKTKNKKKNTKQKKKKKPTKTKRQHNFFAFSYPSHLTVYLTNPCLINKKNEGESRKMWRRKRRGKM